MQHHQSAGGVVLVQGVTIWPTTAPADRVDHQLGDDVTLVLAVGDPMEHVHAGGGGGEDAVTLVVRGPSVSQDGVKNHSLAQVRGGVRLTHERMECDTVGYRN